MVRAAEFHDKPSRQMLRRNTLSPPWPAPNTRSRDTKNWTGCRRKTRRRKDGLTKPEAKTLRFGDVVNLPNAEREAIIIIGSAANVETRSPRKTAGSLT